MPSLGAAARIEFQLPFPEERGGGIATGSAGGVEFQREQSAVLRGGVELHYQDVVIRAEEVEVDLKTQVLTARGDVIIDQGPQRLTGATATYDLEKKTGTLTEATAYVDPDFYFSGEQLSKVGDDLFTVEKGVFSACTQEVPDWSFRLSSARVEVEGYAHIKGAQMRVKKLPVLYLPYVIWPAKRDRASGLLVPQPGYSNKRGASLSLAYYQTLGRSYDTTLYADLYSKNFLGLGNEFRYAPTEGTHGVFQGYAIRDPNYAQIRPGESAWRWKVSLDHTTNDLPFGMRGVIAYRDYSDFDFLPDFERDVDRNSLRSIVSRGFASGNWGAHSLNLLVEDRQTIITLDNIITQRRLPEIEYRLRPTRLGKLPLYLDFDGSASYLEIDRGGRYSGSYGRVDLQPGLRAALLSLPWLSASVNVGERYTWYGDSVCEPGAAATRPCPAAGLSFLGETTTRDVPVAGAQIVGPSFSRIFNREIGGFSKLKHILEPRFTWSYVGDIDADTLAEIPFFDEVDALRSTNIGRVSLVNRILAKPKVRTDAEGKKIGSDAAREIFSFELARNYSFDSTQPLQRSGTDTTSAGPLEALLRFEPSAGTSFTAQARYSTLTSKLTQRSLSGSLGLGSTTVGLTWFTSFDANSGKTLSDQARLWASLPVIPRKLQLETQLSYDLENSEILQQRYVLGWTSQCYGFRLEAREFVRQFQRRERDYRFLLTLKNVGTFLDLNSHTGTSSY